MIFRRTALEGCVLVEPEYHADERGSFARVYSAVEFESEGLNPRVAECSVSRNDRVGTLRGMHFQAAPHEEAKLVRCTRGRVLDVVIDLRVRSASLHKWISVELSAENGLGLYIPEGMAHGFVTLEPATEVAYQISTGYVPEAARGVRWNDPSIGVEWPDVGPLTMSARDRAWPLLTSASSDP